MVQYSTAGIYLDSCTSLEAKVAAIEAIIDALLITAAESPASANYQEYFLDDGQTKISTKYRTVEDVFAGVKAFEKLKQIYLNRLNGRVFRMVDGKNFTGGYPC